MPRKEVEIFSLCMEEKLRRNDHKGGWENVSQDTLFELLKREVKELEFALSNEADVNVMYEAADIANFAMMIAWNAMRGDRHGQQIQQAPPCDCNRQPYQEHHKDCSYYKAGGRQMYTERGVGGVNNVPDRDVDKDGNAPNCASR